MMNKKILPTKKIVLIFVSVFLALIIIFGAVLGITLAVRNSRAAVRYKNVTMDSGVASYFETYYKYRYMSALSRAGVKDVRDDIEFWSTASGNGKTYGEMLAEESMAYISSIAVANYLFNSYSNLSSSDKKIISSAAEKTLDYKADGSKEFFDSETKKYGFDYESFKEAVKMIYKADTAQTAIYGIDGTKLKNYPELAGEYLSEYTHVKLLFIRTETAFVLDEEGNRIKGNDGNDLTRLLTEEEKAERQALISEIRGYISAIGTGDVEMGETMFEYYLDKNDEGDRASHGDGYYFHNSASYTAEFSEMFSDVVEKSYSMKMGEFSDVPVDFGICFIYKCAPTDGAYTQKANAAYFTDFYSDAANTLFEKSLAELSSGVVFTDKHNKDAVITKPYNYIYFPVF